MAAPDNVPILETSVSVFQPDDKPRETPKLSRAERMAAVAYYNAVNLEQLNLKRIEEAKRKPTYLQLWYESRQRQKL